MRRGVPQLESLATVLLASIPLHPGDPPRLVRLSGVDDGGHHDAELGILTLDDGAHPLEGLVGLVAPDEWCMLGTVCTGTATSLDDGRRFATVSAHLVDREGHWAAAYEPIDPGEHEGGACSGPAASAGEPMGRIDDALRRALGLPTAPPPGTTHLLWSTQWLDAIVEQVATAVATLPRGRTRRSAHAVSMPALVGLHPAVTAYDLDPSTLDLRALVDQGHRLAADRDWSQLRRACTTGLWTHPSVDADVAAWLDDGSFARWVLGDWPDLEDLLDAVDVLLEPADAADIACTLDAWGVLPPAPRTAAPT
jgi:hypothetical protein